MNILFVVPYVPNLIRTRSYNLIRSLQRIGHEVSVYTLWSDEREKQDADKLSHECHEVHALHLPRMRSLINSLVALPTGLPLQAVYSWLPMLASQLEKAINLRSGRQFDIVHVEHLRGARYGMYLKEKFPHLPVIWDSVDCISYLFAQAAGKSRSLFGNVITRFELPRTRAYERMLPGKFDHVLITSPIDRQALWDLMDHDRINVPISIISNGVDWEYFSQPFEIHRDEATIVFSGKMSYHANITMALYLVETIMPLIWQRKPDIRLYIVGKDPPPSILHLGIDPRVIVTGTVDDLRPYLKRASAAVVPLLYGAGSQVKVLEAMACGTPVVVTPRAIAALQVVPGRDVLVASQPEDFSQYIVELVENPSMRERVGQAGKKYVEENHRWSAIATKLDQIYVSTKNQLIAKNPQKN